MTDRHGAAPLIGAVRSKYCECGSGQQQELKDEGGDDSGVHYLKAYLLHQQIRVHHQKDQGGQTPVPARSLDTDAPQTSAGVHHLADQ